MNLRFIVVCAVLAAVLLACSCSGVRSVQGRPPALGAEHVRNGPFEKFQKEFRTLKDSGHLAAAEATLEEAQRAGLEQPAYQQCVTELAERRAHAMQLIAIGDDLLRTEHFKQARAQYEQARKIDRDNSLIAGKIAMADQFHRDARARNVRAILAVAIPVASQTLTEYFEFKREEERRKREEAEREAEEARRREEQEKRSGPRRPRRQGP